MLRDAKPGRDIAGLEGVNTDPHPFAMIQGWIIEYLAQKTGVQPAALAPAERFQRLGLDSQGATAMLVALGQRLGRALAPTLVWEHPTPAALASHLAGHASADLAAASAQTERRSNEEPIAIIGMACRLPKAPDLEAFWTLLRDGVDAITEVPKGRWELDEYYDPDASAPGKMSTRWAGLLPEVDTFDAEFFGISPREAAQIDPQQRLALELAWEALEDAQIVPSTLRDSRTGVFFGAMWMDYQRLPGAAAEHIEQHTATGQDLSIVSARVSYALGLNGPSLVVNTACSSSLVAVHLACQSLLRGESRLCLAGGVNLLLAPESTIAMSKFGAMAPDGRCKAFDARANGYVRGEGGGVVVLKRYSDALADGDRILCVIRGSAVNNDGFSNGLTAPNPRAQEAVLRDACAAAQVDPAAIAYVETHGTGTVLGDPIEAGALGAVLGVGRQEDRALRIGSVKTNIGHLEAAAGIAGLIKVALCMQHRTLPKSLHFEHPNPHIPFAALGLQVQTERAPWGGDSGRRLAGVSSFGFGGTNCHVVVEAAADDEPCLFTLSAVSQAGLYAAALQPAEALGRVDGPTLLHVCTAAARAEHEPFRLAAVARSRGELMRQLTALAGRQALPGLFTGRAPQRRPRVAFVFGGQGSQWRGMGRALLASEPAARAVLEQCDLAFRRHMSWSLIARLIRGDGELFEQTAFVQPAIFAVQLALSAAWRARGLVPDAVVGQSLGEVAAACVAGALSLVDAARVICQRSRLVARAPGRGGMAVVGLSLSAAAAALAPFAGRLSTAVSSSPQLTVIAGEADALTELLAALQTRGVFCRAVRVDYASHSAQMDPLLPELRQMLAEITPQRERIDFYSTVTAAPLSGQALDAAYWARNLREPVRFAEAMQRLLADGVEVFVEVDPHPVLAQAIEQCLAAAGRGLITVASAQRDESERATLVAAAGPLFIAGVPTRLADAEDPSQAPRAELIVLSAHSEGALAAQATRLREQLNAHPEQTLSDAAYSLATTRSALDYRLSMAAGSRPALLAQLDAVEKGQSLPGVFRGRAGCKGVPKVVFVFPGQGAQWLGMGRALLLEEPVFRDALSACDRAIRAEAGFSVLAELAADEASAQLGRIDVVQPMLFAIGVALAAQWRSWGVEPDLVVGHSLGEIAAAHVAGVLTLEDAVAIICRRSKLLRRICGQGAMALLELPLAEAEEVLRAHESKLSVAASNGPRATVIAGDPHALAEVLSQLEQRSVFCRRINVDVASHSPQVEPLRAELIAALAKLKPGPAGIAMWSTVTGEAVQGPELTAEYWAANLRQPVRFGEVVHGLLESGHGLFIEMSPHPIVVPAIEELQQSLKRDAVAVGSLQRRQGDRAALLAALGALWVNGYRVAWEKQFPTGGRRIALPTYPWQRQRYWIDGAAAHRRATADPVASLFYKVDWSEVARFPDPPPQDGAGNWLILSDRGGVGNAVAAALAARGQCCTVVAAGAQQTAITEHLKAKTRWQAVVYLWGLDAIAEATDLPAQVGDVTHCATAPMIALMQAETRSSKPPRLWIVTRGACVVGAEQAVAPCQAALWGLGRVAALEHPAARVGLVDLDPDGSAAEIELLVSELLCPDQEDQIAFRKGRRHGARLTAAPLAQPAAPLSLTADGSYLVTGGLGTLGLYVAQWLVEKGARHLVLTSRTGLPERADRSGQLETQLQARREAVQRLQAQGARVSVVAVDVSDIAAMKTLLDTIHPPLRGVVHTAGRVSDGLLAHQDDSRLRQVLRPKVEGAWVLHALTREQPLDFFVLFSSLASTLGLLGQGTYAAANGFLDGLAALRRSHGLPAVSIGWGLWQAGMGSMAQRDHYRELGVQELPRQLALSALERLMNTGLAQRIVAKINWPQLSAALPPGTAWRGLISNLLPAADAPAAPTAPSWHGLDEDAARAAVFALVQRTVAEVLGVSEPCAVQPGRGFAEQGLDSLMAVQLRNRLQKELGTTLSSTVAFDHPTVEKMTDYLLRDVLLKEARSAAPAAPAAPEAADEAIAIVGAACRLPGDVEDLEAYWKLLMDGVVAVSDVPSSRWNPADWYDPDPAVPGRTYVKQGGFLRDVETFDAGFFRIAPREALSLDPQQRLLLELGWEALEHAGHDPAVLRDSPTGVFIGVVANEYGEQVQEQGDEEARQYALTGNTPSVTAGRLSYFLGLQGPSLAVDTACSSSLVALHLGCQSLRQGECEAALVGGVNMLLSPAGFVLLSQLRALSPDGRCKPFAAAANGFARAEGGVVVVLKRLRSAQRDGDRILAVIRGSAVNHDGASSGLTVPNGPAQQAVLRKALEQAHVSPAEVDYVECHGTGTTLGDPIEVQALASIYGQGRGPERPLLVGAAKANLGHLEAAAGLVGVLKVLLAFQHHTIPGQPALGELNPHIPWGELPVRVARQAQSWPPGPHPRRAAVSAFGLSGTNAHAVLEEAPPVVLPPAAPARSAELVLLSAHSDAALKAQAARLHAHLQRHPEQRLADIAYNLAHTRSSLACRIAIAAASPADLRAQLEGAAQGLLRASVVRGRADSGALPRVVFVFPGQGSQWLGMGRGLLAEEPVFREGVTACDKAIAAEAGFSVLAELAADEASSRLHQIDVVQPVLFALAVALAALWRSWGVEPAVVIGHSLGEVAAAQVAGALSLEDAAAIICRRSRLLRKLSGQGEMALVELSLAEAAAALSEYQDRLSVAVSNSPRSTVISGEPAALAEVLAQLELRGVFCRRVKVDVASHSPQVEPLLAELQALLADVRPRRCKVPMRSTVTTEEIMGPELSAEYWAQNLRKPVRFCEVMQTLLNSGHDSFLEMSAHPLLVPALEELLHASGQKGAALCSLRRGQAERAALLTSLGDLWVRGYPIRWNKQFPTGGRRMDLPPYPWQRQRYWLARPALPAGSAARVAGRGHPLLGAMRALSTQSSAHLWETTLELRRLPWLRDHRVQRAIIFPGAGYLEMALACGSQLFGPEPFEVADVSLIEALVLTSDSAVQLQVVTTEERPGRRRFQIASQESPQASTAFCVHARGVLIRKQHNEAPPRLDPTALRKRLPTTTQAAQSYSEMAAMGLEYGPAFRGMRELWGGDGEALGRVELPGAGTAEQYQFHPTLLDACLQVIVEALGPVRGSSPWLPVHVGSFQLFRRPPPELFCHVRLAAQDPASAERQRADFCLVDLEGSVVAEIKDLVVQRRASSEPRDEQDSWYMAVEWQPSPVPAPGVSAGRWLLLGDGGALGRTLREALQAAGHSVVQGESLLPNSTALRALLTGSFGDKAPTAVVHLGRVGVEGTTDSNIAEKALLQGCDSALHVVQALVGMWYREAPRLWLFTRGAQAVTEGPVALTQAPLLGLGRTIAVEHPELRCARLDLDPARPDGEAQAVLAELLADDAEEEVALRGKERLVARIVHRLPESGQTDRRERAEGRPFRLDSEKPGVLDRLQLRAAERRPPRPGEVEIAVAAAGLNFADVLTALGIYPGAQGRPMMLGGECAGQVVAVGEAVAGVGVGDEVVAVAPGSFSTHITVSAKTVALRPTHLSAAQAAALPIAYMTAWYGLVHLGRLRAGERVLIHSATGGTGSAAVNIALHLGAEVFATAGTEQKRDWLRAQGVGHVMDSRSLDFAAQVLAATQGEGVDLVLNSLSGPAIEASLATLGSDGRFIELGKTDIYADRALGLSHFKKSLSYIAVDMAALSERRPARFSALLAEVMALIAAGVLPALPLETVPISRAADAFRKMAQAQHIGKLVLTMEAPDSVIHVPVHDKVAIRSDSSYLVTGGLGGLGLKVAEWLGKQGAGHLVLMGRAGDVSFEQRTVVSALATKGTRVTIAKGDVANRAQMEQILADIQGSGMPLRGIVHAAGCLDDGVIMQQTPLRFRTVMGPKVQGAWHLHELTRKQPLDFFVLYASAAGLLGSPGQANYAAANTFLDALAHYRRALGRPALSIDWGAFSEVGLAAAQDNRGARLASRGMHSLTPDQGMEALGRLLAAGLVQIGVAPIDIQQWAASHHAAAVSRRLSRLQSEQQGEPRREQAAQELLVRLLAAKPQARASMLVEILLTQVAQVLHLPENQIPMTAPLTALGMDSLMGLELRNRIESVLGIRMPASLLWNHLTVREVSEYIDREMGSGERRDLHSPGSHPPGQKLILGTAAPTGRSSRAGSPGASRGVGLVRLHTAPAPKLHLICFPPGGGGPELFLRWTTKQPDAVSISGLHLPGRGARLTETPYVDMKQLLDGICDELVSILKHDTPVAFLGHSLGSIVAFETAHQLMCLHGVTPAHLFVSSCSSPRPGVELEHQLGFGKNNASGTFASDTLSDAELLGIVRRAGALGRGAEKLDDDELAAFFVPSLRADLRVLRSYLYEAPRILSIPITAIGGRQDPMVDANRITDWMKHTSQSFSARIIQGDHGIRYEQLWDIISTALAPLLRRPADN